MLIVAIQKLWHLVGNCEMHEARLDGPLPFSSRDVLCAPMNNGKEAGQEILTS